ncbi:MAG TPA: SET domain-containing protein [Spirochaetota bacterium]|nr:SET domain-containing protein [Spirochaetota bacterium]
MNGDLYIKETCKGCSVFAAKSFRKGDVIVQFKGKSCSRAKYIDSHDPGNNHYLQIDGNTYMGPSGFVDDYINHSCNPNSGLKYRKRGVFLHAIRDIGKDEEVTFDYSTTMDEGLWEMDCSCGETGCRGKIRDFIYLPEAVQKRYIEMQIVEPFIVEKLDGDISLNTRARAWGPYFSQITAFNE